MAKVVSIYAKRYLSRYYYYAQSNTTLPEWTGLYAGAVFFFILLPLVLCVAYRALALAPVILDVELLSVLFGIVLYNRPPYALSLSKAEHIPQTPVKGNILYLKKAA